MRDTMKMLGTLALCAATLGLAGAFAAAAQAGEYRPHNVEVGETCEYVDLVGFVPGRRVSGVLTVNGASRPVTFTGPRYRVELPPGLSGVTASFTDGFTTWRAMRPCVIEPGPEQPPVPPGEEVPPGTNPPPPGPPVTPPPPPVPPRPPVRPGRYDLAVSKAGTRRVRAGSRSVYVIRVRNTGDRTLRGVRVRDVLPASAFVIARGGGKLTAGGIDWRIAVLHPGQTRTRRVALTFTGERGYGCNRVIVRHPRAGTDRARACTRVIVPPPPPPPVAG